MKKFFPVFLTILVFSGFLVGQVFFDLLDLPARPSKTERKLNAHYEGLFYKLKMVDTKKKDFDLKALKQKVVILNFWASWCIPCLDEMPSLVKVQKKYGTIKFLQIKNIIR